MNRTIDHHAADADVGKTSRFNFIGIDETEDGIITVLKALLLVILSASIVAGLSSIFGVYFHV